MTEGVANLRPWTPEEAREMNKRAVAAKKRKAADRRRQVDTRAELMKLKIDDLPSREEVGMMASKVALDILQRFLLGEITLRNANEASRFLEVVHNITRLEEGRATSITDNLSAEDRKAMLAELRDAVQGRADLKAVDGGA